MPRRILSAAAVAVLLSCASLASAQGRDPAGAEKLYDEGAKLLAAEDWAGACAKFDQSFSLDPAPGTLLNLASCAEREGKLALAWSRLRDARSLNADTASETRRAEIAKFIEAAITRIEPRIPQLTLRVKDAPQGTVVKRDGQPTPIGAALPVDPGKHVLEVTAPGREPTRREITLAEGAKEELVLEIGAEGTAAPPVVPEAPAATQPPEQDGKGLTGLQIGGIVIGGIGVATLGVSLVTGIVASGKESDLDALGCREGDGGTLLCPPEKVTEGQDLSSSGATMAGVSTATTFIGAALLGTGLVLLLVGGDDAQPAQAAWAPRFGPDGAGMTYSRGF
jgi:hypothetical protein